MKNFAFYKLEFPKGVHFGKGMLNDSTNTFHADMLFSALYIEALKIGKESLFYEMTDSGKLLFSDAFPYMGETYFLPKPMIYVEPSKKGNSSEKKFFKKLQYLPAEELDAFLSGNLTASDCSMDGFGHYDTRVLASIRGEEESMPYYVGTFYFEKGNGLYIIVSYETQEAKILMEELMESLSYIGIGGKKTSGLGKFIFRAGKTNLANVCQGLFSESCTEKRAH